MYSYRLNIGVRNGIQTDHSLDSSELVVQTPTQKNDHMFRLEGERSFLLIEVVFDKLFAQGRGVLIIKSKEKI